MSGSPTPAAIRTIRLHAAILKQLREEHLKLQQLVKQSNIRLVEIDEQHTAQQRLLLKALTDMDVAQSHNAGWEARITTFLVMLVTQDDSSSSVG